MVIETLDKGPLMDGSGGGGEGLPPTANDDDNYNDPNERARRVAAAIPVYRRYGDESAYRGVFPDEVGKVHHYSDIFRQTGDLALTELRIEEISPH